MRDLRGATLQGIVGRPNEDAFAVLPSLAVIADGATSPPQLGDGCIHGPAWYARRLVASVVTAHTGDPAARPAELLADAIASTTAAHADTCDVSHPGTPSATVAMLTFRPDGAVEWLVLGDCTLVLDAGHEIQVVSDDRLSNSSHAQRAAVKTPGGPANAAEYSQRIDALVLAQRAHRNRPGGFWVAAAEPNVAFEAYTGTISAPPFGSAYRGALLTDGASRIVDVYGFLSWESTLKVLEASGPADLLRQVRNTEQNDQIATTYPRIKLSDDATAVFASWTAENV